MHDQKKADRKPLTAEQQQQHVAAEKVKGELVMRQRDRYARKEYTREALQENADLLVLVPEAYTFYNYRREILCALWAAENAEKEGEAGGPARGEDGRQDPVADLVKELKLNARIIEKDFKIYAAFVHRHWVFEELARRAAVAVRQEKAHTAEGRAQPPALTALLVALTKERNQCEALLRLDERNFHVWNHRRWSQRKLQEAEALQAEAALHGDDGAAAGTAPRATSPLPYASLFTTHSLAEVSYTTEKIKSNFSNYSAWHQRALTIQNALLSREKQQHLPSSSASPAATATTHRFVLKRQAGSMPRGDGTDKRSEEERKEEEGKWCDALLSLLQEDLYFLTQAIYCDPNDQSAWFYASFMLSLFAAFKAAYPHYFLSPHPSPASTEEGECAKRGQGDRCSCLDERYRGKDIEGVFLEAIFDLISEEARLGDADCFLPHYFLFSHLARVLVSTATAERNNPQAVAATATAAAQSEAAVHMRAERCVALAKDRQLFVEPKETGRSAVYGLGEALYKHLITADELRRGLYDGLWKAFQPQ